MPVPALDVLFSSIYQQGLSSIPLINRFLKLSLTLTILYIVKLYSGGARNKSERKLHGKVCILTGGTSGVGAALARELALRGAQLVLLTRHALTDPFLVDYIEDLRIQTDNQLITAEQVDLADLLSIRKFATKWIDNAPPRRLDMLILCADEHTPAGSRLGKSKDGLELMMAVNYLANFHLASILSPALRSQPPDRQVRVIVGTCASYMAGELPPSVFPDAQKSKVEPTARSSTIQGQIIPARINRSKLYATTKLSLLVFCAAFQKHLSRTLRKDDLPSSVRVICVDPGFTRTPGLRRYLTRGSLWGLFAYLASYPFWYLVLKSPSQGAQSFLHAVMDVQLSTVDDNSTDCFLIKECQNIPIQRCEVYDENVQKRLWQTSEQTIEALERDSALSRARAKKHGQKHTEATESKIT